MALTGILQSSPELYLWPSVKCAFPSSTIPVKSGSTKNPQPQLSSPTDKTDPCQVLGPVISMVHLALQDVQAWRVEKGNPMHFIFNQTYPPRQFKHSTYFNKNDNLPIYTATSGGDITETDEGGNLAPFAPHEHM